MGVVSIMSILRHHDKLKLTKALLIMPFYSHNQTLQVLKKSNIKIRSIEEFIVKYPSYFANFNERFYSLIPITLNTILLMEQMKLIRVENGYINLNDEKSFDISIKQLGNRGKNIMDAGTKLEKILLGDENNLYLQLRVSL